MPVLCVEMCYSNEAVHLQVCGFVYKFQKGRVNMKKIISLVLALTMLIGMLPLNVFASENTAATQSAEGSDAYGSYQTPEGLMEGSSDARPEPLTGDHGYSEYGNKVTLSILGDSISTYQNYSNGTAAQTTNSTIKDGAIYYPQSGFDVTPDSTWWYQAAQALGMEILVNNSWSGSCLLNTRYNTVGAYVDRCVQLHDDTGDNAGQKPDIIAIFLGTNDYYAYPSTLGSYEAIDFGKLITTADGVTTYAAPATSMEAYAIILDKISREYPQAEVYCLTMLPRVNSVSQPTAFNEDIAQLAEKYGAFTVDLYNCGIQSDSSIFNMFMGDNLHPNNTGMDALTNAFVSTVRKNSALAAGQSTFDVNFDLDHVVAMEGTTRTVISGEAFETTLSGISTSLQLRVSVQMGGKDITASCYTNGVVRIPAVTGDVVITASAFEREPLNFRWDFDGEKDALVSVSSRGNTENMLTMTSGSITDGRFSKVNYTMDQNVILKHDRPWVIEWRSQGSWSDTTDGALLFAGAPNSNAADTPYLFRRSNSTCIALGVYTGGQYHNYGVALSENGIDGTKDHTYRLVNRMNDDGSNMVYLYVDGSEIGPMNHHWIAGTDKHETVDWLNGRDLVFSRMGTAQHTIGNCYIDYIQVWEDGDPSERSEPMNFRWDFDDEKDALVSVSSNGNAENKLTMTSGSITDGKFSKVNYTMDQNVILKHDRPWIIEWRSQGSWSDTSDGALLFAGAPISNTPDTPYLFRRSNSTCITLGVYTGGRYHNYGVALSENGINGTIDHCYRLENRINADGSNMVYLYVDGKEIGPMNHHWIGGTDMHETVDWLNGQDLEFSYMGTTLHTIGNCYINYIQVWENGHEHVYSTAVTAPTCTKQGYTTYTCECGDTYRTEWLAEDAYNGKTIACIGDSITYGYGVTQGNTDYVTLLAEQLGMSYIRLGDSGTTLCTDGNRTCNIRRLTEDQIQGADIVTIALGINDFCAAGAGYYELGDINSTDTSTIYGAARMWCERIEELRKTDSLSHSQFYFMTPVITSWNNSVTSGRNWDQSKTNIHGYTLRDLCNAIMEVAALYDVAVIDMNLLSGMYYVDDQDNNVSVFGGDGVHPGEKGHEMMASALANALLQNHLRDDHTHTFGSWITTTWPSCTGGEQHRVCTICSAVESRTTDPNGNHRYNAVVTAPTYNQQGYTTNTCSVCGDSYISDYTEATQPHSYRWEMQNNALVSVSANGNTVNSLTLTNGSITDGTLHGARYNLQNNVHLRHDLPWAIEWRSAGNWDGMLLASATQSSSAGLTYLFRFAGMDFLALGEYNGTWNNYGLIYKIDMTASHVFRLENRIAADGTNAVYLLVDGQEIDTMDHYYVGGTNKNQTVNWANGQDIVFSNIGTASHPMKDMKLDYLQIWENGHVHSYDSVVTLPTCTEQGYTTYTCDCGDSYVDNYTEATGHSYASGVCPSCGDTKPAPVITKQPETANSALGEEFTICVEAEGDGLSYQWYYKDKGMTDFAESVVKKAVYSFEMVSFRVGRQYYCEITDQYGNTVRTDTVKSTTDLKILDQPQSVEVEIGEKAVITIAAIGEGLQYQWYYKNKNDEDFSVSSYKGKTYSMTMAEFCHNRQVYCVVTDAYGNCVTSEIATMSRPPVELKILNQPADVYAAKDEKFSIKADVQGDGLTYQWYYKEGSGKAFAPSSNKTSAYAYTTQSYMNNRQVYCVITDQYGNQVTTETVTIHVIK